MEEEDVRGDRGLSVFRLRAVSRLTLVVRCTEIGYSVSTQVLGFRFGCGWCCVVGFLFGCCWFCVLLLCVSAWWNRGIADEVTMASYGRAVTGTAVMARSANEEKKKGVKVIVLLYEAVQSLLGGVNVATEVLVELLGQGFGHAPLFLQHLHHVSLRHLPDDNHFLDGR